MEQMNIELFGSHFLRLVLAENLLCGYRLSVMFNLDIQCGHFQTGEYCFILSV